MNGRRFAQSQKELEVTQTMFIDEGWETHLAADQAPVLLLLLLLLCLLRVAMRERVRVRSRVVIRMSRREQDGIEAEASRQGR